MTAARIHGLDTLRAVAILLVIPRHAWEILKWPSLKTFFGNHGWVGVDLFFVLSGFLIGSQLLQDVQKTGAVDFKSFYTKRAFRILPSYFVVLTLYFAWPDFRETPNLKPAWTYLLFVMNFGEKAQAFSHAWSLCIEEHFYIVFPLLVVAFARWRIPRVAAASVGIAILAGMALRYVLHTSGAPFYPDLYRPTHVHLDGLVVGVALALLRVHRREEWERLQRHPHVLLVGGLVTVAAGLWIFGGARSQPDLWAAVFTYPLVSVGFGAVVASAMASGSLLSTHKVPGAATIATLAYALYLTHKQMIHAASRIVGDGPAAITAALSVVLMAVAAGALYILVERPFLKWRDRIVA